jgi:spore coat protein U-like protein
MKTIKNLNALFIASLTFFAGTTAMAGSSTASMEVSAAVVNSCSINADPLAFASYDSASPSATSGTGTVRVRCTLGAPVIIMLGEGSNAEAGSSAELPLRRLNAGGADFLSYGLYQDAAMTQSWGDSEASGKGSLGQGIEESHSVYAKIPQGQNVPAGSYTDSVLATVSF